MRYAVSGEIFGYIDGSWHRLKPVTPPASPGDGRFRSTFAVIAPCGAAYEGIPLIGFEATCLICKGVIERERSG